MATECRLLMIVSVLDVRGIVRGQGRSYHSTGLGRGNGIWLGTRRDMNGISDMKSDAVIVEIV